MDLKLTGKRVLVTGGTRGIGRAIFEAFLDEGAVVGFCARDSGEVSATTDELRRRGNVTGSIVAISTVSGRESDFASGPYGTVKTAIVGFIHGLAMQLSDKGIRANTVSPGNTNFEGGVWASIETADPGLFETAVKLNPTARMGTPE